MSTIYVFNYNNYYNRRFKRESSIADYGDPIYIETSTNCNFNPNDGVTTRIVLGRPGRNNYSGKGDYVIYSENNIDITSRWFIIEQNRTMGNQYDVRLYRDVLADHWDLIKESDCFIERAIVPNENALIFNREGDSFNQIKKEEALLKDKTKTPWIVGYLDALKLTTNKTISVPSENINYLTNYAEIAGYTAGTPNKLLTNVNCEKWIHKNPGGNDSVMDSWKVTTNSNGPAGGCEPGRAYSALYLLDPNTRESTLAWAWADKMWADRANFEGLVCTALGLSSTNIKDEWDGRIVYDSQNGKYYDIAVNEYYDTDHKYTAYRNGTQTDYHDIAEAMYTQLMATGLVGSYTYAEAYFFTPRVKIQYVTLTERNIDRLEVTLSKDSKQCVDAPYKIFAFPYSNTNLKLAQQIKVQGSDFIYDIQVSPYCPVQNYYLDNGEIDTSLTYRENEDYNYIKQIAGGTTTNIGRMWYAPESNISFNIYNVEINGTSATIASHYSLGNIKISNETRLYRFCSPNGAGAFDFNLVKNGGFNYVNIDITFRPHALYLHLNPDFQGLYGNDYNDFRGLICQGDFSIPMVSDKWQDYITQNKNFEQIFNRGIQRLDNLHKIEMNQQLIQMLLGGATTGVGLGTLVGGAGGVLAGGIAAAASIGGGLADRAFMKQKYLEERSYAADIHTLQLGNIQALPNTITSTGCLTANNKLVPYIEFYECSSQEIDALVNKILWNSMTIGVNGKISQYIDNSWTYDNIEDKGFIKAKLIRLEGVEDDSHVISAIADELYKGVYTK